MQPTESLAGFISARKLGAEAGDLTFVALATERFSDLSPSFGTARARFDFALLAHVVLLKASIKLTKQPPSSSQVLRAAGYQFE
jgi:hypothetical protein